MADFRLPLPQDDDPIHRWTARTLAERLGEGDAARATFDADTWPEERARRRGLLADVLIPDWERPDPCVTVTGTIERRAFGTGWTIRKLRFQSLDDYWITALLYVPDGAEPGKTPAMLVAQGHIEEAKAFSEYHGISEELCRQGMVVLAYDPPGQGERVMNWDWLRNRYDLGWGTTEHDVMGVQALLCGWPLAQAWVWDGMRALDVLLDQPDVDPSRVGMCGVSGGGTQTTWLLAADDRLTHASPACFITGWREQYAVKLGADPEQHPFPIIEWGWDQADVLASFAPKPILLAAVVEDFFPIGGTRNTYGMLYDLYEKVGAPGGIALSETPDVDHGYHPPVREATVRWFCEQFGIPYDDAGPARDILSPEELQVTPTGQLITSGFPRTLHDMIVETAPGATSGDLSSEERRAALRELLAIPGDLPDVTVKQIDSGEFDGLTYERVLLTPEPGIEVPVLAVRAGPEPTGVVIHLHEFGCDTDWRLAGGPVHELARAGWEIVSVDPRGTGACRSRVETDDQYNARFGTDQNTAWTWQMLGRPVFGQRVFDVLQAAAWALERRPAISTAIVSSGAAAHWAMVAAALDEGIERAVAVGPIAEFASVVRGRNTTWPTSALVPRVLTWGDMPDVAALVSPRPLTIVAPVDEMRAPVSSEDVREAYGSLSRGLRVVAAGERPESVRSDYVGWLS